MKGLHMPKRRKKARKKATSGAKRVTVTKAQLDRVTHLGASHHAALKKLRSTVRAAPKRKKARKKTAKKARRRRAKR
jgi:hypothetical protein